MPARMPFETQGRPALPIRACGWRVVGSSEIGIFIPIAGHAPLFGNNLRYSTPIKQTFYVEMTVVIRLP
jgi:hypothetical protein